LGDFRKASDIRMDDTEPCNKSGGCPFGGRIKKGTSQWFCEECIAFMSTSTDGIYWGDP
jgi:hypothetical protein